MSERDLDLDPGSTPTVPSMVETAAGTSASRTRWAPVLALGLAMLVVTSELTIASVTLPDLGRELGADPSATAWVLLAYALPMAALAVPAGRWADISDPRPALVLSMAGIGVASILTALAPAFWMVLAGRLLQGIAAVLIVAVYGPVVTGNVPPAQRGRAMGFIITIMTLGTMAGAPLGGLVAGAFGWREVFLLKLPLVAVVIVLAFTTMRRTGRGLPRPSGVLVREALLLGGAIAAVLLAVEAIDGNPVLAAVTAVVAIGLGAWWARLPASRAVVELARSRAYGLVLVALLAMSFVIGLTAFLLPYFVDEVLHGGPEITGAALLFFVGAVAPVSPVAGMLADRFGPRRVALAGAVITVAGLLTMLGLGPDAGLGDLAWRLALIGVGGGLFNPAVNTASLAALPAGSEGTGTGLAMSARMVATTVGPAVTALCWGLAGGGLAGFGVGIVVLSACAFVGVLALLVRVEKTA